MSSLVCRLFVVIALGLSTHVAAKVPEKPLDSSSPVALVVLKADWWQPAPRMQSAFKLGLAPFDPEKEAVLAGPHLGGVLLEAKPKHMPDGYMMATIKPGRWVVMSYSQQDIWALCFNANSLQFEVRPGEVLYLGRFDSLAHRRQLTEEATRSGRTSVSTASVVEFFDLTQGPLFQSVDQGQLDEVKGVLGRTAPLVTAPVRPVEFAPARFGTGSTLLAQRRCSGFLAGSAKK